MHEHCGKYERNTGAPEFERNSLCNYVALPENTEKHEKSRIINAAAEKSPSRNSFRNFTMNPSDSRTRTRRMRNDETRKTKGRIWFAMLEGSLSFFCFAGGAEDDLSADLTFVSLDLLLFLSLSGAAEVPVFFSEEVFFVAVPDFFSGDFFAFDIYRYLAFRYSANLKFMFGTCLKKTHTQSI